MPLPQRIDPKVQRVAARNMIDRHPFVSVFLMDDDEVVLESELDDELWIKVLQAINKHLGIDTNRTSISHLRGALLRSRSLLAQEQPNG